MDVLRLNKDSLITVLDALARDPLLVWGPAAEKGAGAARASLGEEEIASSRDGGVDGVAGEVRLKTRGAGQAMKGEDGMTAADKAQQIISRVASKLNGTDFNTVLEWRGSRCSPPLII